MPFKIMDQHIGEAFLRGLGLGDTAHIVVGRSLAGDRRHMERAHPADVISDIPVFIAAGSK